MGASQQWLALLLVLSVLSCPGQSATPDVVSNSKELKALIYAEAPDADACVRLLHAGGTVGCAARPCAGRPEQGRLLRWEELPAAADDIPEGTVMLVPSELLPGLLKLAAGSPAVAARISGVLVEDGALPAGGSSPAAAAPLAEFALYSGGGRQHEWNPSGSGASLLALPFPVFLLGNGSSREAQQRAAANAGGGGGGGVGGAPGTAHHVARMRLAMHGQANSSTCIAANTCLPLGGHSVAAALPPLRNGSALPLLWVLAGADTGSLFHGRAQGAHAPLSGLIAMLAAADALGAAGLAAGYQRRLVFTGLAGEAWGFMGSKRLLWELSSGGAPSLAGLSPPDNTSAVVEVGPVGRGRRGGAGGATSLFAHRHGSAAARAATAPLVAALAAAAAGSAAAGRVTVAAASDALPGLPPASASSFLRVGGPDALPAALLADFDSDFGGASDYQSQYDTVETIDQASITAAAEVLSRALHALASGGASPPPLPLNASRLAETVAALVDCLLRAEPALGCPLASALLTPGSTAPLPHYIGILNTLTAGKQRAGDPQTPDPNVKKDVDRFLWNFLAFATAGKLGAAAATGAPAAAGVPGAQRCQALNATGCSPDEVCAGSRGIKGAEGLGVCLAATALYVPSYSTALACEGCDGTATLWDHRWNLTGAAHSWEERHGWPADPVWAESNWPADTPHLEFFLKAGEGTDAAVLAAGLAITVVSAALAMALNWAHARRKKRQ